MAKRPQVGVYGVDFAQQENTVLADLLNVQLAQTQCDVQDQLVNNDYEGEVFEIMSSSIKLIFLIRYETNINSRSFEIRNRFFDFKNRKY